MDAIEVETANSDLLSLMTLLSPVFPVGAFSFSHGIEQAVYEGFVTCKTDAESWLRGLLQKGSAWNDTIFLSESWRHVKYGKDMTELAQLSCSMAGSLEREAETCVQGQAFVQAAIDYGSKFQITSYKISYPVAVGAVTAKMGINLSAVAVAFLHSVITNLVQAILRLVPLGQRDGVRLVRSLEKDIEVLGKRSSSLSLEDLGSAAIVSDICAMRHETLYSRIFRS